MRQRARADILGISCRKKQIDVSFSCVSPVIDNEFRHNIVKVNVKRKLINVTWAWRTLFLRKTVRFSRQIMSADKYPSMFSDRRIFWCMIEAFSDLSRKLSAIFGNFLRIFGNIRKWSEILGRWPMYYTLCNVDWASAVLYENSICQG